MQVMMAPRARDGRRSLKLAGMLALAAVLVTGCATPGGPDPDNAGGAGSSGAAPATAVPVTTGHPVTVLDDGSGAQLCLGMVATSLPPQCGGPPLVGWDWSEYDGDYEHVSGVRWGDFVVTGHYDPDSGEFFPDTVAPGGDLHSPAPELPDFSTPCAEPAGGWRVLEPAKTTPDAMYATFDRAATLDGYAVAWMDQSPNPEGDVREPSETAMNDPLRVIVNVRVTDDVAGAEATLREGWGGMLCVTQAEHTEAELQGIVNEIMTPDSGILMAGPDGIAGVVNVTVVYDDGALQREYDERFGPGLVHVSSALSPLG